MVDFKGFMDKVRDTFTQHPHSINETYTEHLRYAGWMGLRMAGAGLACVIHSIFPFLFEKTGSNMLQSLSNEFNERKNRQSNKKNPE